MPVQYFKAKDNASGQLNAGINASVLSIPLKTGEGASFPQPYTGSASSTGSRTVLNDTGDLGGLSAGDFIRNVTDGSWALVTTTGVNSVTTTRLQGGSDNTWASGDVWRSGEFIITLAAINANGEDTKVEEVLISNRSTDTLTVPTGGRGYNGTIAQAFDADDYVQLRVTAPYLEENRELLKEHIADTDSTRTDLDKLSTTNPGEGASIVGVEDAGAYFVNTDVEGVLQEIGGVLGGVTGSIMMWSTDTAPSGWLLCTGQAVSRTTYSTLFALIGTTFGAGDASTTFNVPDLRGRFPLGQDDMGGSAANRVTHANADSLGGTQGAETHTLTTAELPSHSHALEYRNESGGGGSGEDYFVRDAQGTSTGATDPAGSGDAHNNMPPYITLNFIIKT